MRFFFFALVLSSCAAPVASTRLTGAALNLHAITEVEPTTNAQRALAEPDRDAADRAEDDARQSAELLSYLDIRPGMHVAELGAGSGYFTEILARAVGPRGAVVAQNESALLSPKVRDAWTTRLEKQAMWNVKGVDGAYATPFPDATMDLDRVYLGAPYGELVALGVDRAAMNRAVHDALAPGGRYVVLDRVLPPDSIEARREESSSTRHEIESAGFRFQSEGRFLRSSNDARDWNVGDWFLLSFVRR